MAGRVLLIDGGQSGTRARIVGGVPHSSSPELKRSAAPPVPDPGRSPGERDEGAPRSTASCTGSRLAPVARDDGAPRSTASRPGPRLAPVARNEGAPRSTASRPGPRLAPVARDEGAPRSTASCPGPRLAPVARDDGAPRAAVADRRGPGLPRHGRDYRALRALLDGPVDLVAAGLTGFDGDAAAVARALGAPVIVSNDAVIAHLGALGGEPGVVIVAGTGVIALAVGADGRWARADGHGNRLGDDGGGYWIGRRGLAAALRARDGRPGGSRELLRRAVDRFGERIVAAVYDADDPVAVIAAFAPAVADAAHAGDELAASIWADAAHELAATARAAARALAADDPAPAAGHADSSGLAAAASEAAPARADSSAAAASGSAAPPRLAGSPAAAAVSAAAPRPAGSPDTAISYSGGLFAAGELLLAPLRAELPGLRPPLGGALDGAARLLDRPALFRDLIFEAP